MTESIEDHGSSAEGADTQPGKSESVAQRHTPGPWRLVIDDTGGPQSGWPLVIVAADDEDKSVVRPGGQWPYEWDGAMSQREAVANARLIAADPDLLAFAESFVRLASATCAPVNVSAALDELGDDHELTLTVAQFRCLYDSALAAITKAVSQ